MKASGKRSLIIMATVGGSGLRGFLLPSDLAFLKDVIKESGPAGAGAGRPDCFLIPNLSELVNLSYRPPPSLPPHTKRHSPLLALR